MSYLLVALSFVPALAATAWHLSERRRLRRFQAACEAERRESMLRFRGDDEITERRYSFSGWPFPNRK